MHPMSRHQDEALPTSLYTLPAIVLLAAVALSFVGVGFVMPLRALYARGIGASSGVVYCVYGLRLPPGGSLP